jgi:hypothetical protein
VFAVVAVLPEEQLLIWPTRYGKLNVVFRELNSREIVCYLTLSTFYASISSDVSLPRIGGQIETLLSFAEEGQANASASNVVN